MMHDADGRFCYGVNCTWFGSIHEVGSTKPRSGDVGHALPCCPLCGGMLFEMQNEGEWWTGVDTFERGEYPTNDRAPASRLSRNVGVAASAEEMLPSSH